MAGVQEKMKALALVCPETPGQDDSSIIIGMNGSLFRRLAQMCHRVAGPEFVKSLRIQPLCKYAYETALCVKQALPVKRNDEQVGHLTWTGPGSARFPPGYHIPLNCFLKASKLQKMDVLVIGISPKVGCYCSSSRSDSSILCGERTHHHLCLK